MGRQVTEEEPEALPEGRAPGEGAGQEGAGGQRGVVPEGATQVHSGGWGREEGFFPFEKNFLIVILKKHNIEVAIITILKTQFSGAKSIRTVGPRSPELGHFAKLNGCIH